MKIREEDFQMNRFAIILSLIVLLLVGCGKSNGSTWQEQYDLGIRYLSEGNYEEAIIAFTAAIEIDSKQAPAYVGRGDAYILSGATEEKLSAAQSDYEKAIELDKTDANAYLGLADVYILLGDYEKAQEILTNALEFVIDNEEISEKLSEISSIASSPNQVEPQTTRIELGDGRYMIEERDDHGNLTIRTYYDSDGNVTMIHEYNYDSSGNMTHYLTNDYMLDNQHEIFYEHGQITKITDIDSTEMYETEIKYENTVANITHHIWDSDNANKDSTTTKIYEMIEPGDSVIVSGWQWDLETGVHITDIGEYKKTSIYQDNPADMDCIRYVQYTNDGEVKSDERY